MARLLSICFIFLFVTDICSRAAKVGDIDTSFNIRRTGGGPNFPVYAVLPDDDGSIIIGGSFSRWSKPSGGAASTPSGFPRDRIARLDASGNLLPGFERVQSGKVIQIKKVRDGYLVVKANEYDDRTSDGLLQKYTKEGNLDTTFRLLIPGGDIRYTLNGPPIYANVRSDGTIILTGIFTQIFGQSAWGIALLNEDGTLKSAPAAPSTYVEYLGPATIASNGKIFASSSQNLFRFNEDGSFDSSWTPLYFSHIWSFVQERARITGLAPGDGGTVMVAGHLDGWTTSIFVSANEQKGSFIWCGDLATAIVGTPGYGAWVSADRGVYRLNERGEMVALLPPYGAVMQGYGVSANALAVDGIGDLYLAGEFKMGSDPNDIVRVIRVLGDGSVTPLKMEAINPNNAAWRITGGSNVVVHVESSTNLKEWKPYSKPVLMNGVSEVRVTHGDAKTFLRARLKR